MPDDHDLIPIEGNPFTDPPQDHVPVSHDPWAEAGITGDVEAGTRRLAETETARRATLRQIVSHWAIPGEVAAGVKLANPEEMTEEDAAHLNQLNDLIAQWGPKQALAMLKAGMTAAPNALEAVSGPVAGAATKLQQFIKGSPKPSGSSTMGIRG